MLCLKIIDDKHIKQGIVKVNYALYGKLIRHMRCEIHYYSGLRYAIDSKIKLHHYEKLLIIGNNLATWSKKIPAVSSLAIGEHLFSSVKKAMPMELVAKIYSFLTAGGLASIRLISKSCCANIDKNPCFNDRFKLSKLISSFTLPLCVKEYSFHREEEKKLIVDYGTKLGNALIDLIKLGGS